MSHTVTRHEFKFFIRYADWHVLRRRIGNVCQRDSYCPDGQDRYTVRSLYFDTLFNDAYYDKVNGVSHRTKVRLRTYNGTRDPIKLEVKEKQLDRIVKTSVEISENVTNKLLAGETSLSDIAQTIQARPALMRAVAGKYLQPVVMVEYDREAYCLEQNAIRVTFDHAVRNAEFTTALFDEALPLEPLMIPDDMVIMEVKFNEYLPAYLSRLITAHTKQRLAISKYSDSRHIIW